MDYERHIPFMLEALKQARLALLSGDIPVGAIITKGGKIIARGTNTRHSKKTPLGHAEIAAIQEAARFIGDWRCEGTTLYVTLEPCLMCTGAIINARIDRLIYGAHDPRFGAFSLYHIDTNNLTNHRFDVVKGVLSVECQKLLKDFFCGLRK